jgi:hypothetical protein
VTLRNKPYDPLKRSKRSIPRRISLRWPRPPKNEGIIERMFPPLTGLGRFSRLTVITETDFSRYLKISGRSKICPSLFHCPKSYQIAKSCSVKTTFRVVASQKQQFVGHSKHLLILYHGRFDQIRHFSLITEAEVRSSHLSDVVLCENHFGARECLSPSDY